MDFYSLTVAEQEAAMRALAIRAMTFWGDRFEVGALLKYRENAVFSVIDADGRKAVLRIHRHGYHADAALRSELHWMQAMKMRGLPVPGIIPADHGALFVTVACDAVPEPRQVDMLDWIEGEPLGQIDEGRLGDQSRIYRSIGRLAARLHTETEAFPLPPDFVRHAWDFEGLIGERPFWGSFTGLPALAEPELRLLLAARDKARLDLAACDRDPANYGLIHADFVPENLMRCGDELALIDFDDAGYGWHMFELATALYFHVGEDHYEDMKAGIFAGYRELRRLDADQERRLPLFLFLRSLTYLGWVQTRSETRTAQELTPMLIARACDVARAYLAGRD